MNVDSNTGSSAEVLERLAQRRHLLSSPPHNVLSIGATKDKDNAGVPASSTSPNGSSSPSPASVSSFTSNSKVTSSTTALNGSAGGGGNLSSPSSAPRGRSAKNNFNLDMAQLYSQLSNFSGDMAANQLLSNLNANQQRMLMALASANLVNNNNNNNNNHNSGRPKSSSSDGSNNGSPYDIRRTEHTTSADLASLNGLLGLTSTSTGGGGGGGGRGSHAKPRSADSPGSGSTNSTTCSREKVFVCGICNRSFGYKHVLQNHERTHTGEKPFECRECHKRFTRDHHLKTHMRLHTGEKPYHCTHCDRQFVQVANLRRHLRVHTGERPYACELCESKFSDSNQLKAHMLIHKGEKPFSCGMCHGRFRRRHHLNHHKCPKDEANMGRPRRGRRPKAYDQIIGSPGSYNSSRPGSAADVDDSLAMAHLQLTLSATAAVSTSSAAGNNYVHHASKPPASHLLANQLLSSVPTFPLLGRASPTTVVPGVLAHHHQAHHHNHHLSLSAAHAFLDSTSMQPAKSSRRKPRHTTRIVKNENEPDEMDDDRVGGVYGKLGHGQDEQPLNLSLSPRLEAVNLVIANSIRAYNASARSNSNAGEDAQTGNVLDLSARSRSDAESEPEPIEEDDDDEPEEALVRVEEVDNDDDDDDDVDDELASPPEMIVDTSDTPRGCKRANGVMTNNNNNNNRRRANSESEDDEHELSSSIKHVGHKLEPFSPRLYPSMHIKHNNNHDNKQQQHAPTGNNNNNRSLDNLLFQAQLKKHLEEKQALLGLEGNGLSGLDYIMLASTLRAATANSTTGNSNGNGNTPTVSDKAE